MDAFERPIAERGPAVRLALGTAIWTVAWLAMLGLDGHVDLANLAMVLVLASALATLWLPVGASMLASALSVLAFNWSFVPPRGTFAIDLRQDALLLGAMLGLAWIVATIMAMQRTTAERASLHARRAEQLRRLGDALRDATDPAHCGSELRAALAEAIGGASVLLLSMRRATDADEAADGVWVGQPSADQRTGLWHCARQSVPFGPGTNRYGELSEWYLPLRGRDGSFGAAVVALPEPRRAAAAAREHAQGLCDQMGLALERAAATRAAVDAREQAQAQSVRNAMLAAISHDYRTPLATIMGAASSLAEQGQRLDPEHRRRLAQTIVGETAQLSRLTDNTLQLARLEASGVALALDWESAEEIVGAVLQRARRRDSGRRVRARLEPGLPLLRCDALLLAQLLDNLVDNALKYSDAPVELLVRRQAGQVVFAVRDRGPGVAPAWRERIFDVFQRARVDAAGDHAPHRLARDDRPRRGAGVGLAVCRAIARAHGGELKLRARSHGGSSFECWLPEVQAPQLEHEAAAGAAR